MKNFTSLLLVFSLLFVSCEGDPGLPGPQGPPGLDGGIFVGESFDVTVDFQFFPDTGLQEVIVPLPEDIFDSDAVLVYRLEKVVDINGVLADAWSPLPQNFFLEGNDIIQYIYNHTFADVELLIDGNFNLATLGPDFTLGQTFKIVIVPADWLFGVDVSDINAVLSLGNFKTSEITF